MGPLGLFAAARAGQQPESQGDEEDREDIAEQLTDREDDKTHGPGQQKQAQDEVNVPEGLRARPERILPMFTYEFFVAAEALFAAGIYGLLWRRTLIGMLIAGDGGGPGSSWGIKDFR